jgi:MoaA/NifB/PqqE/SkfB family radical SAM enzyme
MKPLARIVSLMNRLVGYPTRKRGTSGRPDAFCIYPWINLTVAPEGSARPCCVWSEALSDRDGTPFSVYHHSLEEIWKSEEMQSIRRDMLQGTPVTACSHCYAVEANGGESLRMLIHKAWQEGSFYEGEERWLNQGRIPLTLVRSEDGPGCEPLSPRPSSVEMHIGNVCNLKCRMCQGDYSSRIDQDAVHSAWLGSEPGSHAARHGNEHWFNRKDIVNGKLLEHPEQIRYLKLQGGETLLSREVGEVLQYLIDAGVAHQVTVHVVTNATTTKAPWLRLTEHFRGVSFVISVDGHGKYYEYIRYPAKWDNLVKNIETLRALPKTTLTAHLTIQNYNVLNIVDLCRYLDSIDAPFTVNALSWPAHLAATNLPPRGRRLAAERIRAYVGGDCRPQNKKRMLGLIGWLESAGESLDQRLLRDFMLFTNDLDVTRGQSFRETHGEFLALLEEAGFAWTAETLHADAVRPKARALSLLPPD